MAPTVADEQRIIEAMPGIARSRGRVIAVLLGTGVLMAPWLGWVCLAYLALAVSITLLTNRLARSNQRVTSGVTASISFQLMLSLGVAATGGLESPFLSWLVVPVTMLAVRYRWAVIAAAFGWSLIMAGTACAVAVWLGTAHPYPPLIDALAVLALGGALGAIAVNFQTADIASRAAANSDPLTGLLNRKALDLHLERASLQAGEGQGWVAVLVCDLDHFKAVNDSWGHAAGDEVLRHAAHAILRSVRGGDRVFRVGGEEFLVLLPGTDLGTATAVGERIRQGIVDHPAHVAVTTSIGAAAALGRVDTVELLRAADEALYAAKAAGRDRVVAAPPVPARA